MRCGRTPSANLRFEQNRKWRDRHNRRSFVGDDELRARALQATALVAQLRRQRNMNVQRQEEQEQQSDGASGAAESVCRSSSKN